MALTQHWKLNETSGTTATATVGNNGTYARDASNTTAVDGPGTAITVCQNFNGTSDDVDISGAGLSFASAAAWSVSVFMKRAATGDLAVVMGVSGATTSRIIINTNTNVQVVSSTSNTLNFTVSAIGTGWMQLLITHDTSNNVTPYINGTAAAAAQNLSGGFAPTLISKTNAGFGKQKINWLKVFNSNEGANAAALYAEANSALAAISYNLRQRWA